ncbi:hypothetical protein ETAA8_11170 [Anatilimnocola aggregata]|uniref:Uncharacterized protein n=1 Tax=Anatilimnocola aggregata TaxID=2528021 RepID=A0A517Y749_9BACT|nr:hypothetical protein [Anatilimnocola aggregata]QDU26045.1 hypothetical protein ETAA8_11170 [Anatilimnocola aggregata]
MRCATIVCSALLTMVVCGALRGEDFRIDTEVFIGSEKKPVIETLTIFADGDIFDFLLTKPAEITVFNPSHGKLTLLNIEKKQRAVITTEELLDAAISVQTEALKSKNPVFVAAAKPGFQVQTENFEENNNKLTRLKFESKVIQYNVIGEAPRHPNAARDFRYFADWYARLNSVRAGNLPAGARLELNEALFKQGLLPTRIERIIPAGSYGRQIEVHSKHLVNWRLSFDDRRRIEDATTDLVNFELVTFEQYCRPATPGQAVAGK